MSLKTISQLPTDGRSIGLVLISALALTLAGCSLFKKKEAEAEILEPQKIARVVKPLEPTFKPEEKKPAEPINIPAI